MPIERAVPLLLLLACGDKADDTSAREDVCDGRALALSDANNYGFTGALDVPVAVTASATDVQICWDQLTQDIQCHALDPAEDIDVVGLVRFASLSQEEVAQGLSTNSLQQTEMSGYAQFENDAGQTCASLSAMSFFGTPIDVPTEYTDAGGTYLLLLSTGTTLGVGARMISFLEPTPSASATAVAVQSGCGVLDFSVDLRSREAARVCATGDTTVDWTAVTVDGQGNPLDAGQVDSLFLGFYEGASVADLEADFLNIETSATRLWSLDIDAGASADLSLASDGSSTFDGFAAYGEGVWLIALRCSRCYNPAPLFVGVLQPVEAE